MKQFKKILALLLAGMMVVPMLASCSETTNTETSAVNAGVEAPAAGEETVAVTEDDRIKPEIPEKADFGGKDIKFLLWIVSGWEGTVRVYRDIWNEAITGEGINDAVHNRNLMLQTNYNVTISQELMNNGEISGAIDKEITAGTNTYSVMYPRLVDASSLYQKNYFLNLLDTPNIDLEKPWWDNNAVESLSVAGKLPAVATSINVNDKDATAAMAFNKTIAANNAIEDPYTLVREGKWTYDKVAELSDLVDADTNGDGKMTEDDLWGFLGKGDVTTAFYFGSGSRMVLKENDEFYFAFGSERDINATIDVVNLMNQPWFYNHHITGIDDMAYMQLFTTGHGLFFWMRMDEVTNMRDGEADFGILPTPKYDEEQQNYANFVSPHTTGLMSLPKTLSGDDLEAVTTVLEAMAAESHYTLIPEYIESSLKTKHSRDAESADMVDIIINHRVFDPMQVYNFGGFADSFQNLGGSNNTDIASFIKKNQKLLNKTIERFMKNMTEE